MDLNSSQVDEEAEHSSQKSVFKHFKDSPFSIHKANCPLPVCFGLVSGLFSWFALFVSRCLLLQIKDSSYLNKSELIRISSKAPCGPQNFSRHTDATHFTRDIL